MTISTSKDVQLVVKEKQKREREAIYCPSSLADGGVTGQKRAWKIISCDLYRFKCACLSSRNSVLRNLFQA